MLPCTLARAGVSYMWNLKYDTNEPIHEAETDSQAQRADMWLPRGMA